MINYSKFVVSAYSISCLFYCIAERVFELALFYDWNVVVAQLNLSFNLAQLNVSIYLRNSFFASSIFKVFRQNFERIFDFNFHFSCIL